MNITEKIQRARKEKNLRQADCAKIIGVTRSVYTRKERGKIPFKIKEIEDLNNKFNFNLSFSDQSGYDANNQLIREAIEIIKDLRRDKKELTDKIKDLEIRLLNKNITPPNPYQNKK